MSENRRFIPYDWFKLLIAIILLLIIIGLWITSPKGRSEAVAMTETENVEEVVAEPEAVEESQPTPESEESEAVEAEMELPPLPEAGEGLSYDAESGFLLDSKGNAIYELNEDGTGWLPVIPDDMAGMQLSSGDDGKWYLDGDKGEKYVWDAASNSWVAIPAEETEAEIEIPSLPEPSEGLSYDAESGFVLDAEGNALYELNEDGTGWVPVIPDEMASMQLVSEEDGSFYLSDGENAQYNWDAATHTWVKSADEEVATEEETTIKGDCDGVSPARLKAGEEAEIIRNLNFRSSPGIGNNWLATFRTGSRVKVLGEARCLPYADGAYRWWKIERADGTIGWSAEAPISETTYFIQPAE
ncbi:MAG: SH3 domain-containing protein [Chloroflexi bacterium]|nr:SH3 domain-containing protein [Chloroflexota bacterium]